jgi:hypothetical protein
LNRRKNILFPKKLALTFSISVTILSLIALLVLILYSGDSFFSTFVVFEFTADAYEIATSIKTAKRLPIMIFFFITFPLYIG